MSDAAIESLSVPKNNFQLMKEIIDTGVAEKCVETASLEQAWYIPFHGVHHPQKNNIREVFDTSAHYADISLNDQLLQGPDLSNGLLDILCPFQKKSDQELKRLYTPAVNAQNSCVNA